MFVRILALLTLAAGLSAQVTTWTGAASSNWGTASNWTAGVPNAATDAILAAPQAGGTMPSLTSAGVCDRLRVDPGVTLTIASGVELEVRGDVDVAGTVTGAGALRMRPAGDTQTGSALLTGSGTVGTVLVNSVSFAAQDRVTIRDVTTGLLDLTLANVDVQGIVTTGRIVLRADSFLDGSPTAHLTCTSIEMLDQGLCCAPGRIGTIDLAGVEVEPTNTFDPQQGMIRIRSGGTVRIAQSADSAADLTFDSAHVIVENNTTVLFGAVVGGVQLDPPRSFGRLEIVSGQATVCGGCQQSATQSVTGFGVIEVRPSGSYVHLGDDPLNATSLTVDSGGNATVPAGSTLGSLVVAGGGALELTPLASGATTTLTVAGDVRVDGTLTNTSGIPLLASGTNHTLSGDLPPLNVVGLYAVDGEALGGPITIDGRVTLDAGERLVLAAGAALHVRPGGTLELLGTPAQPVEVRGSASPMLVEGTLAARHVTCSGMDAEGLRIAPSASLGAAPNDFRGVRLVGGEPGGRQLDLARTAAMTLREVDFDADGAALVRNVRSTTTAPITFVDSLGDFTGPAHEDDPNGVIVWQGSGTTITSFVAEPRAFRVELAFTTSAEGTTTFRLLRDASPLTTLPASGPRTYRISDIGLLAGTEYVYTLQRLSTITGAWRSASTAAAVPHGTTGRDAVFVGPFAIPDIASAIALAPPGGTVFVEPGDYAGFTVDRPLRIVADDLGPVRIVGSVPVLVQNVASAGGSVVLDGLEVRTAIELRNVADPVVLHEVTIPGTAHPGMTVVSCPRVAVQELTTTRRVDVSASTLAMWRSAVGVVDLRAGSRLTHVASTGTFTPDGTSTATAAGSRSPTLAAPRAWPVGRRIDIATTGDPGRLAAVLFSRFHDFVDVSILPWVDMPLLLPPAAGALPATGVFDGAGRFGFSFVVPDLPTNWFQVFSLQVVSIGTPLNARFGEIAEFVIVP